MNSYYDSKSSSNSIGVLARVTTPSSSQTDQRMRAFDSVESERGAEDIIIKINNNNVVVYATTIVS
jgi:hypothetical protein